MAPGASQTKDGSADGEVDHCANTSRGFGCNGKHDGSADEVKRHTCPCHFLCELLESIHSAFIDQVP